VRSCAIDSCTRWMSDTMSMLVPWPTVTTPRSVRSGTLTLTHDTKGVPFFAGLTVETTETGGEAADSQTFSKGGSATTAASGKHHFDAAANWSGAAVPVDGDDIVFANSDVSCLYGLGQSSVTPASITIDQSYTGEIGLPERNGTGSGSYDEYRDTYLQLGDTSDATDIQVTIGNGTGSGSGRIKLNTGDSEASLKIYNTGNALENGIPALLWKGTDSSNTVELYRGSLGIAALPGESATVSSLSVGFIENELGDATLEIGDGVTLTTVDMSGGSVACNSAFTTLNMTNGELTHRDGAVTTMNIDGGTVYYESTGTLTTGNVGGGGVLDFRRNMGARTVTNCSLYENGSLFDPQKTVAWSNGIDITRASIPEVTIDIGSHFTLTPSTI